MTQGKSVLMSDGRTVVFGARMKRKTEILEDGALVRFDFPDGTTRTCDLARVPSKTLDLLTAHGASQKIGDECADLDSITECINAVEAMIARLEDGTAFQRVAGGGFIDAVLVAALVEVSGKTHAEVTEIVKAATAAERTGLRQDPRVAPVVARIEAEKAKGADVAGALGKLGLGAKVEEEAPE